MSKRQTLVNSVEPNRHILVKDDGDLFSLVQRLTAEQPPIEAESPLWRRESWVQIELPFPFLLTTVERLPLDKARLLHRRLGDRLATAATSGL